MLLILLVKPNYRDHWSIPGGYVDQHETPNVGAGRELQEELGLSLPVGNLLVVDWASPAGPRPQALVNFGFHDPEHRRHLLPQCVAPRIDAALAARTKGTTIYLADGTSPALP